MTSVTNIRLRVLPRFPADIQGTDGLTVVREGTGLIIKPDFGALAETSNIPNPAETLFLAWNRDTNSYTSIAFQSMFDNSGNAAGFQTIAAAELATISPAVHAIELYGDMAVGDGLGGLYIDSDNDSSDTFISGDGRTWYKAPDISASRLIGAPDIRDFLDVAPYVPSRTVLKSLDTTKDNVANLTEAGREGLFTWRAGDYSAQLTADPNELIYIKADAIATTAGAWVRQNVAELRILSTVAAMAAATDLVAGQTVETKGYFSEGDGGSATYRIIAAAGGMPDGVGEHILANGLYARLTHSGIIKGEWFGCVGGLESASRLNALNAFAITVRANAGFNAVTITQDAYVTVKDPVLFGTGSTTSGDMLQYHIKLNGRIFVVDGGELESDATKYALTFSGFDISRLELPFMRMNYYCNGVKIAGYIRGIVSGGSISRAAETAIDVSGTCSGTNFYSLRAYQRSATDDQSLLTGYSLTIDTEDVAFYGGQIGIAKWPIWIYGTASGIHFIRMHVHNGSTTQSRADVVTVMNDGVFNIRFENAYFDDGYVVDRSGSLGVTNCLHFYNSAWATLTHPLMRVNVGSASARTTVIDDYRGTAGQYSGGDYMVLDKLSNGSATTTTTYTDGSSRVSMGGNTVTIPYPKPTETETVVQEYYQWYNAATTSHYVLRWINRHGESGAEQVTAWDWDKDALRLRTPSRATATPGIFLGAGFIGIQAANSQADLLLGSASAPRWRINDSSGSLVPETDATAFVGTQANRASRMYANRFHPGVGTAFVTSGPGTPEGVVTATIGSLYMRTDGGAGTTLYVKEAGAANTGWIAK